MTDYERLINEYKIQIRRLEKRVGELESELYGLSGGQRDELAMRISFLNSEIEDMWDSIQMMKGY